MTLQRAVGFGASALAGVITFVGVAWGTRERRAPDPPPPVSRSDAMRAYERERAVAVSMGMTLVDEGEGPTRPAGGHDAVWSRRVAIGARECVAVIAAGYGRQVPTTLSIQSGIAGEDRVASGDHESFSRDAAGGGLVTHAQWCELEARERVAVLETHAISPLTYNAPLAGTVHFAVYRARWDTVGGPARLRRGAFGATSMRLFPTSLALDEAQAQVPPGGRLLGAPVSLGLSGARLLPSGPVTYRALYEAVRAGADVAVNPRVDASRTAGAPWETGMPVNFTELYASARGAHPTPHVHDAVIPFGGGGYRRVLAVVDAARLGAPCAALMFTRMLFLHAASVRRTTGAPGDDGVELPVVENVATDRQCPAAGPAVYTVDDHDQEEYSLRVFALPDAAPTPEAAAPAAPAGDEAPQHHAHGHAPHRHH